MTGTASQRKNRLLTDDIPIYSCCHALEWDDPRSKQRKIIDKLVGQIVRFWRTPACGHIVLYQSTKAALATVSAYPS